MLLFLIFKIFCYFSYAFVFSTDGEEERRRGWTVFFRYIYWAINKKKVPKNVKIGKHLVLKRDPSLGMIYLWNISKGFSQNKTEENRENTTRMLKHFILMKLSSKIYSTTLAICLSVDIFSIMSVNTFIKECIVCWQQNDV